MGTEKRMTDEAFEPVPEREVTELLRQVRSSDAGFGDVVALVYEELKRVGRYERWRFNAGETMRTTALVNEAYMKLQAGAPRRVQSSSHLKRLMAKVMRQLILDHARRESAQKRGDGSPHEPLDENRAAAAPGDVGALLQIEDAFERMEQTDPRMAEIAAAKMFCGYTLDEIAAMVGCSERTARRDYKRAQAWLRLELEGPVD